MSDLSKRIREPQPALASRLKDAVLQNRILAHCEVTNQGRLLWTLLTREGRAELVSI